MAYFGLPIQKPFTDFPLGDNELFIGIPHVLMFYVMGTALKRIGMYEYNGEGANPTQIWIVSDSTFPTITILAKTVMIYNGYYTFDFNGKNYYFSTLKNGNKLPAPGGDQVVNPPISQRYKLYRYFTHLNYGDINLNNYTGVVLGWSSSDISGNYGNDVVIVTMYTANGDLILTSPPVPNGTPLPIENFSFLPSGSYYFKYYFTSLHKWKYYCNY
jgi:hypothetical protein